MSLIQTSNSQMSIKMFKIAKQTVPNEVLKHFHLNGYTLGFLQHTRMTTEALRSTAEKPSFEQSIDRVKLSVLNIFSAK